MTLPGVRTALSAFGAHMRRKAMTRATPARARLDAVVCTFLDGYAAALDTRDTARLVERLSQVPDEYQGFAFEGAAMGATLLDRLTPWTSTSFRALLQAADRHVYVLHVGAGWAHARLGHGEGRWFTEMDPMLRWLALDGGGFHDGFFGSLTGRMRSWYREGLSPYGQRAFDQGLGRSLWFTEDADVARIAAAIRLTSRSRHDDLWSGVGLACTFAGGVDRDTIERLRWASGASRDHLAQGSAFGSEAMLRACGRVLPHTDLASRILCGSPAPAVAAVARDAATQLTDGGSTPAYEIWRSRVRERLREARARAIGRAS